MPGGRLKQVWYAWRQVKNKFGMSGRGLKCGFGCLASGKSSLRCPGAGQKHRVCGSRKQKSDSQEGGRLSGTEGTLSWLFFMGAQAGCTREISLLRSIVTGNEAGGQTDRVYISKSFAALHASRVYMANSSAALPPGMQKRLQKIQNLEIAGGLRVYIDKSFAALHAPRVYMANSFTALPCGIKKQGVLQRTCSYTPKISPKTGTIPDILRKTRECCKKLAYIHPRRV